MSKSLPNIQKSVYLISNGIEKYKDAGLYASAKASRVTMASFMKSTT